MSPRQRLFVLEYLKDFNATQAYMRAGYKSKGEAAWTNASRLLNSDKIQSVLRGILKEIIDSKQIEAEYRVRNEVMEIALADISEFVDVSGNRLYVKNFDEIGSTRPIKSVREKRTTRTTKNGDVVEHVDLEFTMHDKLRALESAIKILEIVKEGDPGEPKKMIIKLVKGTEDW